MATACNRVAAFCARLGLRLLVLLAPMAGACPPAMSAAVANGTGMGAGGALLLDPAAIGAWSQALPNVSNGAFQINLWSPGAPPVRDALAEARWTRAQELLP